jgi:hypothetical protein
MLALPMTPLLGALDLEGKPVIALSTAEKDVLAVVENLRRQVKNGKVIAEDGFYAVQSRVDSGLER